MKIALLNLPIDDNYGGNLQRFALVKVLKNMGHEVTHLLTMRNFSLSKTDFIKFTIKRLILRFVFRKKVRVFAELYAQKQNISNYKRIKPFYDRYIKHTEPVNDCNVLKQYNFFDAYIVGSDQVWRKQIVQPFPLKMFLWDYLPSTEKKIAYAASLGNSDLELDKAEAESLRKYYNQFSAVSVREKSALNVLDSYGWTSPKAEWLVDSTLLLKKEDYLDVIKNADTTPMDGEMFCYILDSTQEKMDFIEREANSRNMKSFITGLHEISIEQWLRNFNDAKFIVTDSYHGFVFSLIFNKPVKLFLNEFRGNARFESLFELLGISKDQESFDWSEINATLANERQKSLNWLKGALNA
ncbi:hypothetical protein B7990_11860 [Fibrobacter sp. UWB4]|uniref:polysaccharide pyruvyl transferase family protein n=1 Tax=Fibrobacter sp. UWB4 TaxID=1964356 RepID=UPI000B526ED2|nr:polysaccharide pyruvyl transferase family protein [Fibrobacter sp. UWB4]OWV16428.1 hypothetical protein B7990_11860 [Fibrobacter sp. UWB4]